MSFAARIRPIGEVAQESGVKILVYGPAGAGKTTLCATTGAKTLVLSAESGLLSIQGADLDVVQVESSRDLEEARRYLATGQHDYRWVCLDSVSEIAEVLLHEELGKTRDPRQAYGELGKRMVLLMKLYRDLSLNVLFIAKQESKEDEGTLKYRPSFPGQKLAQEVPYLFDEVFALRIQRIEEEGKAMIKRALLTCATDKYDAKDRSGKLALYEPPDLAELVAKILS